MARKKKWNVFGISAFAILLSAFALRPLSNLLSAKLNQKVNKNPELLIISISYSGGHMSAANAIKSKMKKQYGYESEIFLADTYDFLGGNIYETGMNSTFGRLFINIFSKHLAWPNRRNMHAFSMESMLFKHKLAHSDYRCIISVIPFIYKMVTQVLEEDRIALPFLILPTDWEDPALGNGFWIDGPNALYLLGTDRLWEQCPSEYQKRKIDGMILRPEFTEDVKPKEDRREELSLPKDKPIIMIMFGKCASEEMINAALSMKDLKQYHFLFLCGSNKQFKESIEKIKKEFNCEHYTVYGFLDNPHRVMQASDIFVGKPGPGALSEAMCYEIPILYSKDMILEQEKYNANRVEELGIGIGFMDTQELVILVPKVINEIDKIKEAYKKVPKNNALNQVCEVIATVIQRYGQ